MKKLEIIIKPEKLESLKNILDDCEASGLMITTLWVSERLYTYVQRYNV